MNISYLKPEFQIGKSGINGNIIKDIKARLKKKRILKIKFLPTAIKDGDKKEMFNRLAKETSSRIIRKIGFTLVLEYEGN